ncbi:MAG: hypothetical protein GY772_00700 [bacterium]|nr:hypothetical protein [bacterium]
MSTQSGHGVPAMERAVAGKVSSAPVCGAIVKWRLHLDKNTMQRHAGHVAFRVHVATCWRWTSFWMSPRLLVAASISAWVRR